MKKLAIIFSAITLMAACKPQADPEKIEKVEGLKSRIDSSASAFEVVDSSIALQSASHYADNISYIKSEYTDTIGRDLASFIDKYYAMRKAMKLIRETYGSTQIELEGTIDRLGKLIHDLEHGLIEEEQFVQYYQLETNNIALIEESIADLVYAYESVQPLYDEMNPRIDSLIEADKSKKQANE